jgi:large subunit ribosomal protein L24
MKIKREDKVMVNTGSYKNKIGRVLKVFPKSNKVLVEGVNFATMHIKPKGDKSGEIRRVEKAIHISNVNHLDPQNGKATKVKIVCEGKKKHIVSKMSGEVIR